MCQLPGQDNCKNENEGKVYTYDEAMDLTGSLGVLMNWIKINNEFLRALNGNSLNGRTT